MFFDKIKTSMFCSKMPSLAVYVVLSLICCIVSVSSSLPATEVIPPPENDEMSPAPAPAPEEWVDDDDHQPPGVFDVTDYGAVGDGTTDNSLGFLAAWEDACGYEEGNATLFVPNGTFFLGPVTFQGPCHDKKSPTMNIRGILKAPPSLLAFRSATSWITFRRLHGLNLVGKNGIATLDGQGQEAWTLGSSDKHKKHQVDRPTSLKFVNISSGSISNISLLNSKNFHMSFFHCDNIVVNGVQITAPWNSPNTDGIHISASSNIKIASSTIGVGDDCVSIGPGTRNILILNVTCGPGHGISIGSLGKYKKEMDVSGVTVKNCTINGTSNGVRVKTWPGSPRSMASNFTFQDIVMINVSNPIIIDQEYCPNHACSDEPSLVKLKDMYFRNIKGTYKSKPAVTLVCSPTVACENVQLLGVKLKYTKPRKEEDEDGEEEKEDIHNKEAVFTVKGALHGVEFLV